MKYYRHPRTYESVKQFDITVEVQRGTRQLNESIVDDFHTLVDTYEPHPKREDAERIKEEQVGGRQHAALSVLFGLDIGSLDSTHYEYSLTIYRGEKNQRRNVRPDYVDLERRTVAEFGSISQKHETIQERIRAICEGLLVNDNGVRITELPYWRFYNMDNDIFTRQENEYKLASDCYDVFRISSAGLDISDAVSIDEKYPERLSADNWSDVCGPVKR
jgi:hypothetical protein